jgi:hypothetical protein
MNKGLNSQGRVERLRWARDDQEISKVKTRTLSQNRKGMRHPNSSHDFKGPLAEGNFERMSVSTRT